ncbi:IclR family transcriptional regulator [Halapricum hydrolyticum]|uniref:IclR family transcriptional regulator n=1 Tax=Halapricum hydrolyticum TaxID=2979991 RepID=A0AAE3IFK5_9EURY|nr:IclR family transcriptional regulator [Halapricum hydrolyticum]MCU4718521.1 IclR family transcriptional regulator [Halapricum hydrolyticum]MCU4727460.1 IclR family transcriptional regulator [Halapricum hydrolyticum]
MTADGDPPVKAVQTSHRVLEAIIDSGGMTLADLVERLEHSRSSIHNHLSTLTQLGYVVKDGQTYRASLRFLEIGTTTRTRFALYNVGRAHAENLSNATGLSASLLVFERGQLTCLYTAPATGVDDPAVATGDVLPLHCTAPGKAILAAHPPEEVSALLSESERAPCTENTQTTAELRETLESVRTQGWAVDREEWRTGIRCIATAVTDTNGRLHGALCVTGSTDALSGKRFEQDIPGLLISSAHEIQSELE